MFRENDRKSNPLKYIESMKNDDCNRALIRILGKIDFNKIFDIFNEIPEKYGDIVVMNEYKRNFI